MKNIRKIVNQLFGINLHKSLCVRLMLIFVFTFTLSLNCFSQNKYTILPNAHWQQVEKQCKGCGSAFFMLYRNPMPNKFGQYESYVYVWSNSFNKNGIAVSTYITRPRIYILDFNGFRFPNPIASSEYHLARPSSKTFNGWNLIFYLYSPIPNQIYVLEFDAIDDY